MSFSLDIISLSFSFWFARVLLCFAKKTLVFSSWLVPCACTFSRVLLITRWLMDIRWRMERLCDSSEEVFLCLGVFVAV